MALLSVLTPVLALVLCLFIGYMLVKSRDVERTSRLPEQAAKVESRPWVDQDPQDDSEHAQPEDGKTNKQKNFILPLSPLSGRFQIITGLHSCGTFKKIIKFDFTYVF